MQLNLQFYVISLVFSSLYVLVAAEQCAANFSPCTDGITKCCDGYSCSRSKNFEEEGFLCQPATWKNGCGTEGKKIVCADPDEE
uniref:Uncharacterized protein n=1 Tax=Parasitella parasitica TaxID=35722 RepID=Q8J0K3_9FUNG|nr:hypothetical protein [Parasitella parasitica]